ncbi:putative disease resistance RPP13-like protein 1 isoform X1 [Pyrus x bretschneideri]|uniref:putative disease resistance RPP13-like protein 1 isoform X1 n=1 Tax=Pyrus x bretschneideri TaxID=225117 RepID=UPI00202E2E43|nr:putative disease resistance RPP13-like protein 1 isoform X1 [Pyrus x bretschneideri]XP_048436364.1 putative disease resistance RPP13-like protein 1 isoform X1 [Pyrus x bretschneideri]
MAGPFISDEASLSASVQLLCKRIDSCELGYSFGPTKLDKSLVNKLKLALLTLDAVLDEAHEKEFRDASVANWLDEFRKAVSDTKALLDEIDVSRNKMEAEDQSTIKTPVNILSDSFQRVDREIAELSKRLEFLANKKDVLGLGKGLRKVSQAPTTSLVDESRIYGREQDKEKLIKLLISADDGSSNNVSVITIEGMVGIGKTTLAQLIYNDENVAQCFDLRAWVYVSEDFDATRVTKTILELVTATVCDINDLNFMQANLKDRVMGKKFLFILDDLCNENYHVWKLLQAPFQYGAKGSKVVITTRNTTVASIVRNLPTYCLQPLSGEATWLLILQHALGNRDPISHRNVEKLDKETAVRKCHGLPIIAKTLGGLLRHTVFEEWHRILNSNFWELPSIARDLPTCLLQYMRQRGRESHNIGHSTRTKQANSAEWIFLVTSLCLEIVSAACDQASSPSKLGYALSVMLLAIAAVLICIWELIHKGREENFVRRKQQGIRSWIYYMLLGSLPNIYGLLGGITQFVF